MSGGLEILGGEPLYARELILAVFCYIPCAEQSHCCSQVRTSWEREAKYLSLFLQDFTSWIIIIEVHIWDQVQVIKILDAKRQEDVARILVLLISTLISTRRSFCA